jgi:hypothetical protein
MYCANDRATENLNKTCCLVSFQQDSDFFSDHLPNLKDQKVDLGFSASSLLGCMLNLSLSLSLYIYIYIFCLCVLIIHSYIYAWIHCPSIHRHVYAFGRSHSPFVNTVTASTLDDGNSWRKYGQKRIQESPNPRYVLASTLIMSIKGAALLRLPCIRTLVVYIYI